MNLTELILQLKSCWLFKTFEALLIALKIIWFVATRVRDVLSESFLFIQTNILDGTIVSIWKGDLRKL